MAKKRVLKCLVTGTGLHQEFLVQSHEIVAFPASTYHKFTYPNGVIVWKNDFGISSITLTPFEINEEQNI